MCVSPTLAVPKVVVHPAIPRDCPTLTAMVRRSAAYDGPYRVMVANQTIDEHYIRAHPVRVAMVGSAIVGFYSLLVPGCGADREGELDFMFVADGWQGRGIGRRLFDDLRQLAASLGLRRIHIVAHPPAEQFYRAQGAVRTGDVAPAGRVTWTRPRLVVPISAAAQR